MGLSIMNSWINDLRRRLGEAKVSTREEDLRACASDKWNMSVLPEAVVYAESREDVQEVMRMATEYKIPVTARGGGVGYVGGCVPVNGGIVLALERMDKILEMSPDDGIVRVQPGVITGDIQDAVRALGWFYPPDPSSLRECTIGGNIATNAGGPRCLKYGVTKNYVLGLEVVLADGRLMHCGGRTHKNKTGFELTGLFCGSEGMLGIVTEATLRIIPQPESRGALSVVFPDFSIAARAVQMILNSGHLPSALEITDAFTLRAARAYLGEDVLPEGEGHLLVEIDGRRVAVSEELDVLADMMVRLGGIVSVRADDEEGCEALWRLRREFSYGLRNTGMTKLNEDIVVPRSKLTALVDFCKTLVVRDGVKEEEGLPELAVACFGHAGDGNIHTNVMVAHYEDPKRREEADDRVRKLFAWVLENGGAITGEHGIGIAKAQWFTDALDESAYAVHCVLKQSFDPLGILNPGKMGLRIGSESGDACVSSTEEN